MILLLVDEVNQGKSKDESKWDNQKIPMETTSKNIEGV